MISPGDFGSCAIGGGMFPREELVPIASIAPAMAAFIRKRHPDLSKDHTISASELNQLRMEYLGGVLAMNRGVPPPRGFEVPESPDGQDLLPENIHEEFDKKLTRGEFLADKIAEFGGSWTFIGCFAAAMVAWIVLNSLFLVSRPFDPYPYILLNLVLSCLAAIQAPVIMMSQNRVETRDRFRAEQDYKVNVRAASEIRHMHDKIDHLMEREMRLFEAQQIQLDLLKELADRSKGGFANRTRGRNSLRRPRSAERDARRSL